MKAETMSGLLDLVHRGTPEGVDYDYFDVLMAVVTDAIESGEVEFHWAPQVKMWVFTMNTQPVFMVDESILVHS